MWIPSAYGHAYRARGHIRILTSNWCASGREKKLARDRKSNVIIVFLHEKKVGGEESWTGFFFLFI